MHRSRFVLAVALAFLAAPYSVAEPSSHILFVSPAGDDAWSGALASPAPDGSDGPFATLSRARDAVRELGETGLRAPTNVYLRDGTYFLTEPVVFTPEDSGTADAPISYEAYPGESPVLSGGRRLPALREVRPGVAEVTIPDVRDGWFFAQLFSGTERLARSRLPREGFYRMAGPVDLANPVRFTYRDDDIDPQWAGRGVEVNAVEKWAGFRMPIASVDARDRTVTLTKETPPYNWGGARGARYWIENAPEGVTEPGDWALDRERGTLTYLLRPDEHAGDIELIAPTLQHLVVLDGRPWAAEYVEHLSFSGITFAHTAAHQLDEGYGELQAAFEVPAAFHADGARAIRLSGNTFIALGGYAVEFRHGSTDNSIVGSHMTGLGGGGVKLGESIIRRGERNLTARNLVTDNHIHDIGILYPAAVGILVLQSSDNTIAHNLIHDTYYTAISVGWTWGYSTSLAHGNLVESNHAWNIGRGLLSDMGGVYTLGPQEGTVVRNNVFRDIRSYDYGGWGLYTDEGSMRIVMEHNIVYRTRSAGFHQHYGRENIIRNNIFAYNDEYQLMRTRAEDHLSFILERNIILYDEGELLGSDWSGSNYLFNGNLYWREGGTVRFQGLPLARWQARGQDEDSIIADPRFADPRKGDFTLHPESPAFEIGFEPIDVSRIGPREPWRTPLVERHNRMR